MTPGDERSHPPGDHPWWGEAWDFDFATADAGLGGFVRLGLLPNQGACWYWACVTGAGRDLTMVVDHDVPPPSRPGSLEVRAHGLWADHIVETPLDHVSVGCEAFALRFDDPAEALAPPGLLVGDPIPFGLDLGWETDPSAPSFSNQPPKPRAGSGFRGQVRSGEGGYSLPCRVVGEVLVADERIPLDAHGWRHHTWGVHDWWSTPWHHLHGRLTNGTWICADTQHSLDVEVVATAPVLLTDGTTRTTHLTRSLCRISDPTHHTPGAAWTETTTPAPRQ